MSLDSDQRSAIEKLSQLKAGALFMKMGTGKTKVACDLVRLKLKFVDIVIWIAPASLVGSKKYLDEIRKWSRGGFGKISFYTTESISTEKFLRDRRKHIYKEYVCPAHTEASQRLPFVRLPNYSKWNSHYKKPFGFIFANNIPFSQYFENDRAPVRG